MRKITLLFLFSVLGLIGSAQTEHLKFAGIPLNGTITQFQQKLLAKGYKANTRLNPTLPKGTRAFKGTFMGKNANVSVFYNVKNSVVFGAKAYFENLTEDKAKDELQNVKNLLTQKYAGASFLNEEHNGFPCFYVFTTSGSIFVYLDKDENLFNYPYHFYLHLQYEDRANSQKNEDSILDDL